MIKPIDNIKDSWKFSSVQLGTVGFAVLGIAEAAAQQWITLPPEVQAMVPMAPVISWVLIGLTVVSRLFKFTGKADEASS